MVGCPYEGRIAPEAVAMVRFRIVKIGTQCVRVSSVILTTDVYGKGWEELFINNQVQGAEVPPLWATRGLLS